jgi:hypothetical protein
MATQRVVLLRKRRRREGFWMVHPSPIKGETLIVQYKIPLHLPFTKGDDVIIDVWSSMATQRVVLLRKRRRREGFWMIHPWLLPSRERV